jgi:hypothetical protein
MDRDTGRKRQSMNSGTRRKAARDLRRRERNKPVLAENPVRGLCGIPSSHRTLAVGVQPVGDGDSGEPSSHRAGWPEPDPLHNTLLDPPLWPMWIAWPDAKA